MSPPLRTVKLAEIAELNPRLAESLDINEPVSFLPMSAITAETASTTRGEDRPYGEVSKGYTPFLNGDVLLSKITPCFENGKIAQARLSRRLGFGSTEFHVIRAREGKADARYLLHFLRQEHIRRDGERKMTGSAGQRRVPEHFLLDLEVPAPELSEQRRIADVLDRTEALRAMRRAALAQLDVLIQSIFTDLFGNPIKNEKRWPLTPLRDLARIERGKFTPRPRNDPSYYGGKFPFIQTGDISNCDGRVTSWSQTLNEKGVAVSRSFLPGTVVIAIVGATLGITAILDVEVYCPDSIIGIRPHLNKARAEYVEWVLRFWRPIFVERAPDTARANINLETLRPLHVPNPPVRLQDEFATRVATIEKLKATHRASLAELDALFANLQHRAFRGELQ